MLLIFKNLNNNLFCSKICNIIFNSIHFIKINYDYNTKINFPQLELFTNESRIKYINFIESIDKFDDLSIFFDYEFYNNNIFINKKEPVLGSIPKKIGMRINNL